MANLNAKRTYCTKYIYEEVVELESGAEQRGDGVPKLHHCCVAIVNLRHIWAFNDHVDSQGSTYNIEQRSNALCIRRRHVLDSELVLLCPVHDLFSRN